MSTSRSELSNETTYSLRLDARYPRHIVFASPSRVLWVPLLPAVLGTFAIGVGVAIGQTMLWFALGGAVACGFAVVMSRRVRREGDRVTVRGVIAKGMNTVPRTMAKLKGAIPTTPSESATALVKEIEAPFEEAMAHVRAYYDRK